MMHTPIAAYRPTEDPKPSNYLIDGIGIAASEVSDDVSISLFAHKPPSSDKNHLTKVATSNHTLLIAYLW
jgi:hypothetical protein